MENKAKYALNPNTNRLILKTSPMYKRLVKLGEIKEDDDFKPPKLVVEKKVKAVANVNNLSKVEIDDLYHQLKALKLKNENVLQRRGRPEGKKGDDNKPKIKEMLKPKAKQQFDIKVKPSKPTTDTEYEPTELDI